MDWILFIKDNYPNNCLDITFLLVYCPLIIIARIIKQPSIKNYVTREY